MAREVVLGDLIQPAKVRRAGSSSFPILSMTMREGLVDQSEKFKKRVASADTSPYRVVEKGQLVVGFPIDEGVLSIQQLYPEAIVSPAYEIWDLVEGCGVDPIYLERYLRSPRALSYYRAKLQGSTARRRSLPRDIFLMLRVPVPGLEEQQRIVEALYSVDSLRAKRKETIALLGDLALSTFIEFFGDPSRNPHGWPVGVIGDMVESAAYGTAEKASLEGEIPVLRMNNVTADGRIDMAELKYLPGGSVDEKYLVRSGDVLFNRTNSADLVGKTAIYRRVESVAYAGYLVRVRVNASHHPEYLAAFLNTPYAKRVLRNTCKSIIGMANINAKDLQRIKVPLPPLTKQREFADVVRQIEASKAPHEAHLAKLDELFISIQQRAFNGTLWDHEPTSA